jgi:hypothetical protein
MMVARRDEGSIGVGEGAAKGAGDDVTRSHEATKGHEEGVLLDNDVGG